MGVEVFHDAEKAELVLVLSGNLDLSIAFSLLDTCNYVDERLQTCIINATQVSQVFDSGIEMILLILKRVRKHRVQLVVIGEILSLLLRQMDINNIDRIENNHPETSEAAPDRNSQIHTNNVWKIDYPRVKLERSIEPAFVSEIRT